MGFLVKDKHFYKKLVSIAMPVAMQSVITVGVNLIDTIMLGRLGETALSASSLANQFITLFIFMCMGISMGASVLTGRFWGARDMVSLKKVVTIAYRIALGIAFFFTVVNFFLAELIMRFYSGEADVVAAGIRYLRWSTPTFLLMALNTVSTNVIRSVGVNHISFMGALASFGVNIGANYVLIFGKLGFPAMGVAGAALGTVIARVVETCIVSGYVFFVDKRLCYRPRDLLGRCADMLREFLRISIPVMLSDSLLGLGESMLAVIMGHIGSQFVAANAITVVVQRLSTIFISGMAHAGCIITSQTLGENRVEDARRQGTTLLALGAGLGLAAAGIILLLKHPVINSYNITNDTKGIADQLMNAIALIVVFRATNSLLTKGVLRGGGDTKFLVLADTSTMWLIAIPLGALAGLWLKLPPFWIYVCLHFDQMIKAVWCVFRLRSGKWIKRIYGVNDKR